MYANTPILDAANKQQIIAFFEIILEWYQEENAAKKDEITNASSHQL